MELERRLANRVYVFCPEMEKGIMFCDQSPSGGVAELAGYLPEGQFWSSLECIVEWDERINGIRNNALPIGDGVSYVVSSGNMKSVEGSNVFVSTIMVSVLTFKRIMEQINKPVFNPENNYKIIDFGTSIKNFDSTNEFENDILDDKDINNTFEFDDEKMVNKM